MTAAALFAVGQTVVFLAVCGFALWCARLVAEAADNSARAAEEAANAARDAERTAADIREMRDLLRTSFDREQDRARGRGGAPADTGRTRTDTAESQAVLTPQAVIARGEPAGPEERPPGDAPRSSRGRHARPTTSPWTAALRAAASRSSRDS